MHPRFAAISLCATLTFAMPAAFAQSASAPTPGSPGTTMRGAGMSPGSQQMHESMMSGMEKMQGMRSSGDVDKDFAMMMRMHHQQGVEMAKVEAQQGKSAELKAMAQKIIKDQEKEIAQLDKWLSQHK